MKTDIWEYFAISFIIPLLGGYYSYKKTENPGYFLFSFFHPLLIFFLSDIVVLILLPGIFYIIQGILSWFLYISIALMFSQYLNKNYFNEKKENGFIYTVFFSVLGIFTRGDKKNIYLIFTTLIAVWLQFLVLFAIIFLVI